MDHNLMSFCRQHILDADQCSDDYPMLCRRAKENFMNPVHREVLKQLIEQGPVWDGDIISKVHRDDLLFAGLASRACVKGEQGFTVANYRGWNVYYPDGKQ